MRCAPWTTAMRSGWIAAIRGRNATGVSGAKLAAVRGKAKSPLGFPFVRLRGLRLAMMSSSGQSWNVLTQIPGEPGACRMCGRIRCVAGEMSRWAAHAVVRPALQHRDTFQLVAGEMLWSTFHRFIARGAQEPGHGESLGQMLLVVPAIEFLLFVCRNVSPDHQQPCALLLGHRALLLLVQGDTTVSRPPEVG